jgi:dienelactone hydrolase
VRDVARPGQCAPGRADRRCTALDWTTRRFAPEVVAAVDAAIDHVRAQTPDRALVLVGYSGGGVVAALVAARRHDVALLITVAAPLDPAEWTRRMGMSPLEGSDSPVAHVGALAGIPQVDFAGARDATVPVGTIRSEIDALGPGAPVRLVVVPDFDHHCCWARDWVRLRAEVWQGTGRRGD